MTAGSTEGGRSCLLSWSALGNPKGSKELKQKAARERTKQGLSRAGTELLLLRGTDKHTLVVPGTLPDAYRRTSAHCLHRQSGQSLNGLKLRYLKVRFALLLPQ